MALRTGAYTPTESAAAQHMRNARDRYKVIGRALNRSEQSVKNHLTTILFTPVHATRGPTVEQDVVVREAAMLRRVQADGGYPRVEIVRGRAAWVYPYRQPT